MGSPACRTRSRNATWGEQELPWAGELGMTGSGPSYDFSSLALNLWATKRTQKNTGWMSPAWWRGAPDPAGVSGTFPSLLAGLHDEACLAPKAAPKAPANSRELQEVIPPPPPRPRNACFPVLIHKPLPHRVSSPVKDAFIMFREGLSLSGKNMH